MNRPLLATAALTAAAVLSGCASNSEPTPTHTHRTTVVVVNQYDPSCGCTRPATPDPATPLPGPSNPPTTNGSTPPAVTVSKPVRTPTPAVPAKTKAPASRRR